MIAHIGWPGLQLEAVGIHQFLQVLMQNRRFRAHCLSRIEHGGQDFVVHVDQGEGFECLVRTGCNLRIVSRSVPTVCYILQSDRSL